MTSPSIAFDCRPLDPYGMEVIFDLREPMSADQRESFRNLFYQHGLLVLRNQTLTQEAQIGVMGYIGAVLNSREGIGYVANVPSKGHGGTVRLAYHSELSFLPEPYKALSLHAVEVADGRSSTKFANAIRAYAALPAALQSEIETLTALHAFSANPSGVNFGEPVPAGVPSARHPVVLRHPVTGTPLLYVNELCTFSIENVPRERGIELLQELGSYLYRREHVYEHHWNKGDIVLWDNFALQHARDEVSACGTRVLQRVTVADKGFVAQAQPSLSNFPKSFLTRSRKSQAAQST